MPLTRRRFNQLLAGGLGAALTPNVLAGLVEGQDWRAIARPQSEAPAGKIELTKFFSYGCPFCGQLARVMKPWLAEQPDDVVFRRVPISFNRTAWANLARLALALEETGLAGELDQAVFDAVGVHREPLFTETAIMDWLGERDVDTEAFRQVFNASHIRAQVARNDRLQTRFGINSVPTLVVDGRFVVVGEQARSFDDILDIAGQLIDKART
ncbi:thiol:disulfide interchange protein DsbA/DsbL [Ectothiorhodospira lacustris]|uniref:thiol:disulfide interchange protein DsbA/DsbL n=1 Tax=Ectothiorhodospira lacustris TaxID=2899127 RepID=UPI001EE8E718|nr:thiol:disulfide interchange protein DsbA/DsbL [Ectothiorhodospira lacustris]MCG5499882.1 thiol:disulfide interchange protein DsbA/DsbL [Ectothiorhodospira lacustris]MCG5509026.1 thiol:disulfide interchange protein DsbA/DsbL [Ectothiorhodospira lacustris]MCG5520817.1 thiol:disulfide interchange protein DsbA/DsbL [Ectothiorhodospira lacustris]